MLPLQYVAVLYLATVVTDDFSTDKSSGKNMVHLIVCEHV